MKSYIKIKSKSVTVENKSKKTCMQKATNQNYSRFLAEVNAEQFKMNEQLNEQANENDQKNTFSYIKIEICKIKDVCILCTFG